MNSLSKALGVLGGIVVFCGVLMVGLLRDYEPLFALKRAALGGGILAIAAWAVSQIALNVVRDGVKRSDEGPGT